MSSDVSEELFNGFHRWKSENLSSEYSLKELSILAQIAQVEQNQRIADELVEINARLEGIESIETLAQRIDSMASAVSDLGINLQT